MTPSHPSTRGRHWGPVVFGLLLPHAILSLSPSLHAQTSPGDSSAPVIALWTSQDVSFGALGLPQPVLNILGNVSGIQGVASLQYSVNGESPLPLSVGPDLRRLARQGDFNIDISAEALVKWPQTNTVTITASDSLGHASSVDVHVANRASLRWPLPYEVSWSTPSSLEDSAQVLDGRWSWTPQGITPLETGYDRLVAIGDTAWRDYEITAEVTVLTVDTSATAYDDINGGPGIGFLLRWNGHTETPGFTPPITQPRSGYLPLGAIGWHHWRRGAPNRWELLGNNLRLLSQDTVSTLEVGLPYRFKMRVVSDPGIRERYSFKHWRASEKEPAGWQLAGFENPDNPEHGSLLLLAHHVKAAFGKVTVTPLGQDIAVTDIRSVTGTNSAFVIWKTNARSTGRVLYGINLASPDTSRTDSLASFAHQLLLPDLASSARYHLRVEARAEEGTVIVPAEGALTTRADSASLAFKSDSFDSTGIDSARWTFINPDPPSTLSMIQDGNTQAVTISIPTGPGHDIWRGINAPRVMQPAANVDFQAQAKFISAPTLPFQIEGILVQQDFDNFIRFDFVSDLLGLNAFAASFDGGEPTVRGSIRTSAEIPLYLQVSRKGDVWKSFFSHDSTTWTVASNFTSAMRVNGIGLFIGNAPGQVGTSPAFTGIIDHFQNLAENITEVTPPFPTGAPLSFALEQNYPNPFNPKTVVSSQLPVASFVRLVVYDLLGREVAVLANEPRGAGSYHDTFDGSRLASGVYICRLTAGLYVQSRVMLLLK